MQKNELSELQLKLLKIKEEEKARKKAEKEEKNRIRRQNALRRMEKKEKAKNNYEKRFENEILRQRFFENQYITKNVQRQNLFLSHFNSVTGIQEDKKTMAYFHRKDAKKQGIEEVFKGSRFYWNKTNKALYILIDDYFYAITQEGY